MLRVRTNAAMMETTNGLRVLVVPDASTNLVQVDLRVEVGASEDPPGKEGLAHVVEHALFLARPDGESGPSLDEALAHHSLFNNAYTTWDATHFLSNAPADKLDQLVEIELKRLSLRCGWIDPVVFEREREVVRNEIRDRWSNLQATVHRVAYSDEHPYGRPVSGTDSSVASLTLGDVCAFYGRYYTPGRSVLVVSGDVSLESVREVLNRHLGGVPARPAASRQPVPAPGYSGSLHREEANLEHPTAVAFYALPPSYSEDAAPTNAMMARLDELLELESNDDVVETAVLVLGGARAPVLAVAVSVKEDVDPESSVHIIDAIEGRAAKSMQAESLHWLVAAERMEVLERAENLSTRGRLYADYLQFTGKRDFVVGELERLRGIGPVSLAGFAEEVLEERRLLLLEPGEETANRYVRADLRFEPAQTEIDGWKTPVDVEEAHRPLSIPSKLHSPATDRFTLDNGLEVWLRPTMTLPVVEARLVIRAGNAHEPPGQAGLADAAVQRLSIDLSERVGVVSAYGALRDGGYLDTTVGADVTTFRAVGLSGLVDHLIGTLAATAVHGTYDEEAWKKTRERLATALDDDDAEASRKLLVSLREAIYGDRHPFGRTRPMSAESIRAISLDDMKRFRRSFLRPDRSVLIVAGHFDSEVAEAHIRYHFAGWEARGETSSIDISQPAARPPGKVRLELPWKSSRQTELVIGFPTPPGVSGDYPARLVLEELVDRRVAAVRHELGASYGIYGGQTVLTGPGMLTISGSFDRLRASEVEEALGEALDSLRRGDDFEADFVRARRAVVRRLLVEESDASSAAKKLAFIALQGRDASFFEEVAQEVAQLSPERVAAAIDTILAADAETTVLLGASPSP